MKFIISDERGNNLSYLIMRYVISQSKLTMSEISDIKKVIEAKKLDPVTAEIASECMVELCQQCGTKKRLAKLGNLFENLTDAVIAFDLNLNVIDTNKLGEAIQRLCKTFYFDGKNYKLNTLPILNEVIENKSSSSSVIEMVGFDAIGNKHIFNVGGSPIFSETNVLVGACLIVSDITEIQKQARQLEDIINALTHDLKTPLVAAETSIKHLIEGSFGSLNSEQKQILTLLGQSNSDALRLVKNLLSVFKYETKSYKLFLESVEILELLSKAIDLIKPLLEEKKISLKIIESSFQFICDSFEIERVLVNLLTNAIKYTPNGGRIVLRAVKNETGDVIVTVEDNGKGISKEELPNLFERFWQSRKSNSSSNSTGLGLYLSRQIIEAHGGRIWAESEIEKGTKIVFELPEIV